MGTTPYVPTCMCAGIHGEHKGKCCRNFLRQRIDQRTFTNETEYSKSGLGLWPARNHITDPLPLICMHVTCEYYYFRWITEAGCTEDGTE